MKGKVMKTDNRVRVYLNLNRKKSGKDKCLSVQTYIPGTGWRVADYANAVFLRDVTFEVNENGRKKVLVTGRKNVHAYVVGMRMDEDNERPMGGFTVRYNPKKVSTFVDARGMPVHEADWATVTPGGVIAGRNDA